MVTCVRDTIVIIIKIIHVGDAIIVIVQVDGVVNTVGIRVTGLEQTTLGIISPLHSWENAALVLCWTISRRWVKVTPD